MKRFIVQVTVQPRVPQITHNELKYHGGPAPPLTSESSCRVGWAFLDAFLLWHANFLKWGDVFYSACFLSKKCTQPEFWASVSVSLVAILTVLKIKR